MSLGLQVIEDWRRGPFRSSERRDVEPRPVDLRRARDSSHRDAMGLQTDPRRLLGQPLSTSSSIGRCIFGVDTSKSFLFLQPYIHQCNINPLYPPPKVFEITHIETHWDYRLSKDNNSANLYPHPQDLRDAYSASYLLFFYFKVAS